MTKWAGVPLALLIGALALAQGPTLVAEKISDLPNPEKVKRSAQVLVRMRKVLKEVTSKFDEARASRDVIKLNCVSEKLGQVKGLLRITEQSDLAMQEAMTKNEGLSVDHEYTKITIAKQRVEQLRAEAEECIGQLAFRTDEGVLIDVTEPELPLFDEVPPALVNTRPPPASPTL